MCLPVAPTIPHFKVKHAMLLKIWVLILKCCYVSAFILFLIVVQVLQLSLARDLSEGKKKQTQNPTLQNLVFSQSQCGISFLQLKLCSLWLYELRSTFLRTNERILFHYIKNCGQGQLLEWSQTAFISKCFSQMHDKKKNT